MPMHFNTETTVEEAVFQALNAVDTLQTFNIADDPAHYRESMSAFVIGAHPSRASVAVWAVTKAAGHFLLTKYMFNNDVDPRIVRAWECVTIGVTAGTVANNYSIGLRMRF